MEEITNRTSTLPQNVDAEASLLGSLLIDGDALTKIDDIVAAEDFFDQKHATIFKAMRVLYDKRSPIDLLTLSEQLKSQKRLDAIGGAGYLTELTNFVPTAAHVEQYARIVADKAIRRRLISASQEIADVGRDEDKGLEDLIEEAESKLFDVSQRHIKQDITSLEAILGDSFDRLDDLHKNKGGIRGIPTGLKELDRKLAGLQKSDLFVIASRPAMGKTSLMLNIGLHIGTKVKQGSVLIFSLEMSKEQLVDRLLAAEAGVDAWALRTGEGLTDDDFERISSAMGELAEASIFIDDTSGITVSDLRTKARRLHHQQPLAVIMVDYLQLMSGGSRFSTVANRVQEISEISRNLKILARELNVPVVALSQLSRSVESRSPQIPQLADLRESGSIEQDADVVVFIYREDYYNPESNRPNITDILIKKHRNGPVGNLELYFDRDHQRYRDIDTRHTQEP
ncbi:replicative DNA helicase [Candidatus Saccharibacteria bacterium RIFCSPLOWO2_01_FULL_48_13]|nr:MAG: replicative DNA helicase [Candidatus Saccharibacteria bacterium RIFCSPHIGHO2_01_FULL_48_12]OGL35296.1 MAG: replicative DNA helicase [Candidatus Saccharibacteria bacterium RIFCSPHIGHO2_12_FULL_48_21]OGL37532.1 MAG: replicative DNA helicase [Candidatus Saccharibacteria bacterium RIFCSPLOWO2_01_FULL_48_13]